MGKSPQLHESHVIAIIFYKRIKVALWLVDSLVVLDGDLKVGTVAEGSVGCSVCGVELVEFGFAEERCFERSDM